VTTGVTTEPFADRWERPLVEAAYRDRALLEGERHAAAVESVVAALDRGELRVASPPPYASAAEPSRAPSRADGADEEGAWTTHAWIKEAVLLYFALRKMEPLPVGPYEFHDKIPLKKGLAEAGVRVVPTGTVRYGAFLERGAIVMPGFVNIGARVGAGTMVDAWATVGSCAQVGRDCHLAGGVGIGGVLEPPNAQPVIVEDGVFVGSRAVIVEGVRVGREAVIGAGVVLTASTAIIDVSAAEPRERRGFVPPRSVVIPGVRPKKFPAGEYGVPCALIIGRRNQATDRKVSLEAALRDFGVPV
jgi:2,3,4,5-tetrahydropyridine-2-carboxylate N-succinyltransferase